MPKVDIRFQSGTSDLIASVFYADGAGLVRRRRGCREEVEISRVEMEDAMALAPFPPLFEEVTPAPVPPALSAAILEFPRLECESPPVEIHILDVNIWDEDERPKVVPQDPVPTLDRIDRVKQKLKKNAFDIPDRVLRHFVNLVFGMSLRKYVEKGMRNIRHEDEVNRRKSPRKDLPLKLPHELKKSARERLETMIHAEWLCREDASWGDERTANGNLVCQVVHERQTYVFLVHPRKPRIIAFHTLSGFTAHKAYRAARHRNFRNAPRKKHPLRFYRN